MSKERRVVDSVAILCGGHFGAFWHTGLDKKNAQNVGFEHFGTFWHPGLAEREVLEPFLVSP